jgi:outer membrane immunogenic protein
MKRLLLTTALVACAAVGSAGAADLPVKAPPMAVAAPFTWTGCYVGGNAGWIGGADRYDLSPGGGFLNPINLFSTPANNALLSHSYTSDGSRGAGFTGGGQVGCNYQSGMWVWGVEADINGSGLRESITAAYGPAGPFVGGGALLASSHTEAVTKDLDWFSTFRGRIGFTPAPQWLLYGTGGLAVARIHSTTNVAFGADQFFLSNGVFTGSDTETRWGWTAGAGVEYAFTRNWSFKAEYLYLDFGRFSYLSPCQTFPLCTPAPGQAPFAWNTNVRAHENVARVGLNYKFDWGGPVVAKY